MNWKIRSIYLLEVVHVFVASDSKLTVNVTCEAGLDNKWWLIIVRQVRIAIFKNLDILNYPIQQPWIQHLREAGYQN